MKINLVHDTIDSSDIQSLIDWLGSDPSPRLTKGPLTVELEEKWANYIGTKYSVYVNSGSSAILLTLYALLHSGKLKNKKIVVPSLSWATDLSSPIILGMEPLLCDCNLLDLSVDLDKLEDLFKTQSPGAFILVSALGLVPDMDRIVSLCEKYDVVLLEDVCESMGSKYQGTLLGNYGLASFYSLYFGHHLSTIEGGFINTNDEQLYHLLLMMRSHGWDRDLPAAKQQQLRSQYNSTDFNALYNFYVPGFNLRATDLQAFIGLRVLDRLKDVAQIRNNNYLAYNNAIKTNLIQPKQREGDFVSSFAYPVLHERRDEVIRSLQAGGVEVRPLIAGNMASKPMWFEKYQPVELPMSERVEEFGFYIPNHQNITNKEVQYIADIINKV